MQSKKLLATTLMLMFALAILSPVIPVGATVSGSIHIVEHKADIVAPGGAVQVDATGMTATGATIYFYLSKGKSGEIEAEDIYVTSMDKEDVEAEPVTIWVRSTIAKNETYYVKATDVKGTGKGCVASSESFDVPLEWPTVTTDPTEDVVGEEPTIEGKEAEDYVEFEFYWDEYDTAGYSGTVDEDGEFKVEDYAIPHGFEGSHKIIVLYSDEDGDTLSTSVDFTIKPDVEIDVLSITAEETQSFTIAGTGFPEGTVAEDVIELVLEDFKTGSTIETWDTTHDEEDVSDVEGSEGDLDVDVTVHDVEIGIATLKIKVDGKTRTFEDVLYVSDPTDVADFTTITHLKASVKEGVIGDEVTFSFINLPAGATIKVSWGLEPLPTIELDPADENGAAEGTYVVGDLDGDDEVLIDPEDIEASEGIPGGEYSVNAIATADGKSRTKEIGKFEVLPEFKVWNLEDDEELEEAQVTDELGLRGTGFPIDSTVTTSFFGTEKVDCEDFETENKGVFLVDQDEDEEPLKLPHISGGGKSITVTVEGEDSEGEKIEAKGSLIVNPKLLEEDLDEDEDGEIDWEVGVLEPDGTWTEFADASDAATLFPGNPIKIVGFGYLGAEAVSVKVLDADGDLIATATITSGEKADSSGDLELVAKLPVVKALYPMGKVEVDIEVSGATTTNEDAIEDLDIAKVTLEDEDLLAKLFFGLEADGDLDTEVNVGDSVSIVGVGFRTKSLTLIVDQTDEEVADVSAPLGAFEKTITIPEMEGSWDPEEEIGKEYTLVVDETGTEAVFTVVPKITLDPSEAYEAESVTVKGKGFEDGKDVDIIWVGVAEEETLETVSGDDITDGSFQVTVDVPKAVAQSYRIKAVVTIVGEEQEWADATFTVLDIWRVQIGQKITDLTTKVDSLTKSVADLSKAIEAMDPAAIARAIDAMKGDVSALKTAVDALKTDVSAAKTAASDAKTAASDAKTAASDAKATAAEAVSAASEARTAASDAKAAAQAAQSTAAGISTAAYGAMVLALVAAIFAIIAVVQLQRKVAG